MINADFPPPPKKKKKKRKEKKKKKKKKEKKKKKVKKKKKNEKQTYTMGPVAAVTAKPTFTVVMDAPTYSMRKVVPHLHSAKKGGGCMWSELKILISNGMYPRHGR